MDIHTKENSIRLLSELRDVYQGQLDASVIVRIEEIIAALETQHVCSGHAPGDWTVQVLKVIAEVIHIVTNISDLMQ